MFRNIAAFFRRIFRSRWFRRAGWILLWFFLRYHVIIIVDAMVILMQTGDFTFEESLSLIGDYLSDLSLSLGGISLGIILGLLWYLIRRSRKAADPEEEEETAEKPAEAPAPQQEEEFPETKYFSSH